MRRWVVTSYQGQASPLSVIIALKKILPSLCWIALLDA
jgi:hypothetical protein